MKAFDFEWWNKLAPERRDVYSGEQLAVIPTEVYVEIFDHVDEFDAQDRSSALSNLTLVCRFFCATSLPRIFKNVRFSLKGLEGETSYKGAAFCREVIADREPARSLCMYVKACHLEGDKRYVVEWTTKAFLNLYTKAIMRFKNLERLRLEYVELNCIFFKSLRELPNMKSLTIHSCKLDLQNFSPTGLPALEEVEICHNSWSSTSVAISQMICSPLLRILRTDCWELLQAVITQPIDFLMEELAVGTIEDEEILSNFLNRTPTLQKITLPRYFKGQISLLPSSLPLLKSVECSSWTMAGLISGRPVEDINVSGAVIPQGTLQMSTGLITRMHIKLNSYIGANFETALGNLRYLRVSGCESVIKVVDQFLDQGVQLPQLQHLELDIWNISSPLDQRIKELEIQREREVVKLAAAYPSLRSVKLGKYVEWQRVGKGWRPFQPRNKI